MLFLDKQENIVEFINNNSLGIYSRCGLGDLLILKDFVTSTKESEYLFKNNKRFLHIKFLKLPFDGRCLSSPGFLDSVLKPFCDKIFSDIPNVIFSFDNDPHTHVGGHDKSNTNTYYDFFAGSGNILSSDVFPHLSYPDMSKILFDKLFYTPEILTTCAQKNYICIHTRYRNLEHADINFLKSLLLDILVRAKLKIVLIGERDDSCNFFSIYTHCINLLPKTRVIDLTTNVFSCNNVLMDAYIAKRSKLSIGFGIGGNIVLNTYSHTPTYSYTELGFGHSFFDRSPYNFIYNEKTTFLLAIKNAIKTYEDPLFIKP